MTDLASKKRDELVRKLQKEEQNRKCLDCDRGGSTYCVFLPNDMAAFACVTCAGIHRTYNHRSKGISVSVFSDEELEILQNCGNRKVNAFYMATHNPTTDPLPNFNDKNAAKRFLDCKYEQKQWFSATGTKPTPSQCTPSQPKPPTTTPKQHSTPTTTTPTPANFDMLFTDAPEFAANTFAFDTSAQDSLFDDSFGSLAKKKEQPVVAVTGGTRVEKKKPKATKGEILSLFDELHVEKPIDVKEINQNRAQSSQNQSFDFFGISSQDSAQPSQPRAQSSQAGSIDFFELNQSSSKTSSSRDTSKKHLDTSFDHLFAAQKASIKTPKGEVKTITQSQESSFDFFEPTKPVSEPKPVSQIKSQSQESSFDFFEPTKPVSEPKPVSQIKSQSQESSFDFFGDFEPTSETVVTSPAKDEDFSFF
ncbi:hypothetical protein RCL1_008558 [Eukaryota sp. TZLM3-RCL]